MTSSVNAIEAAEEFVAVVQADVVEWPRLSQVVRLERESAVLTYHVYDKPGKERGIFYNWSAAIRFAAKYGFPHMDTKPILRQYP